MADDISRPAARGWSSVPRWSHRDPVEGGNPFPTDDPRHQSWAAATDAALAALARFDADLRERAPVTTDPATYRAHLLALAEARFDTWAERGLAAVRSDAAVSDYTAWLGTYVENWLTYVSETCPRVEVGDELRVRLTTRADHWRTEARTAVG